MKRFLFIIISLIFCFTLISCQQKGTALEEYTVYLPEEASAWERNGAYSLVDAIEQTHGKELDIILSEDKRSDFDIIIGKDCLSEEQQKSFDYEAMGHKGFAVAAEEGRYVISATNEKGLALAIEYFVSEVLGEELSLAREYSYTSQHEDSHQSGEGYINVDLPYASGIDVYKVPKDAPAGYRYGPSIIVNEDGSMDMWLAGGGSGPEQWDWIVYMHSDDGEKWSEEKCVLQPTPNALDHYSCCDPGVIYLNGYYYLGYTSTLNANQCDNNLFVARSKNPDGPFEKWNGEGWGGNDPKPIVYFSEDQQLWGIGEVSFVELNGTLYIYYTENGTRGNVTCVATADANDENWPLTMESRGVAIDAHTHDSIDVKYIEEYDRFIAVASDERLSKDSYLLFLESSDGITFEAVDACKKNVRYFCHNPGIAGRPNGHITPDMDSYVAYAYGEGWGKWNTRLQEIDIFISDTTDFEEINGNNLSTPIERDDRDVNLLRTAGISALDKCVIRVPLKQQYVILHLAKCNVFRTNWKNLNDYRNQVELYGYDESIVSRPESNSLTLKLNSVGETMITVEYDGHLTYVYLIVYDNNADPDEIVSVEPIAYDVINMNTKGSYQPQIKSKVTYADGRWEMVWSQNEHGVSYEYDSTALEINENSYIYPKKPGSHTVTIKAGEVNAELTVNVTVPDYSTLDFTHAEADTVMLRQTNNCEAELTEKGLKLTSTTGEDPFITIDYTDACLMAEDFSSISIKYSIPTENKGKNYSSQTFFRCGVDSILEEKSSQRSSLIANASAQTLTLDLSDKEYWKNEITEIRFDFFDSCSKGDVIYIESITLNK